MTSSPARPVFVALLPSEVASPKLAEISPVADASKSEPIAIAVVIDTLRFTTTACQSLHLGARSVQVASTVEQARELATELPTRPLLCGERHCHRIEGFDLGNSPLELSPEIVSGRDLVFTTTNGTLAIEAVRHVPRIVLAALVNRQSVCQYLSKHSSGSVLLVCAGTDGQITWEDVLTAGAIIDQLCSNKCFRYANDTALLAHSAWKSVVQSTSKAADLPLRLEQELIRALGGRNLLESGYHRDLTFAAQLDSLSIVAHNSPQFPHRFSTIP